MRNHVRSRSFFMLVGMALMLATLHARLESRASATAAIQELRGVDELKTMFNRDTGKVRLVLLLSPT